MMTAQISFPAVSDGGSFGWDSINKSGRIVSSASPEDFSGMFTAFDSGTFPSETFIRFDGRSKRESVFWGNVAEMPGEYKKKADRTRTIILNVDVITASLAYECIDH